MVRFRAMKRRRGTKRTHHGFCKVCGTKLYRGRCITCDSPGASQDADRSIALEGRASRALEKRERTSGQTRREHSPQRVRPSHSQKAGREAPRVGAPVSSSAQGRSEWFPKELRAHLERRAAEQPTRRRAAPGTDGPPTRLHGCLLSFFRAGCALILIVIFLFATLVFIGTCAELSEAEALPRRGAKSHAASAHPVGALQAPHPTNEANGCVWEGPGPDPDQSNGGGSRCPTRWTLSS